MVNKGETENIEQEDEEIIPPKKDKTIFIIKKVLKVIETIILIVIFIISAIIITQRVSDNENTFLGYRIFRVQTGSMVPVYNVGDVILVKEKDINKIKVDDDVTYWGTSGVMKGKLVTHRVIKVDEEDGKKVFHTQGVANNAPDPVVYPEYINGVVQGKLHIMTWICSLVTNQYMLYFLGIVPLTILIFFNVLKSNTKKIEKYKSK